jgi:hypothetical protein
MAFSQNPFSVASFGESYEQADVTITVTGFSATLAVADVTVTASATVVPDAVEATASINGNVSFITTALFSITGVQATGEVDTNSVVIADALVEVTDSLEATVTVDPNSVVTADANVVPTAVEATGEVNDALTITGTALFSIVGVEVEVATDDVIVNADALVVISDSFEATLSLNGNVTVTGTSLVVSDSVEATVSLEDVTVTAQAIFDIDGVEATTAFNGSGVEVKANADVSLAAVSFEATLTVSDQLTVSGSASVTLDDVSATISIGDLTIAIVSFDYEAVKENYNRLRTVYIKEITDNVTRTVYVNEIPSNVVYIEPQPSNERTVYVEQGQTRTVYIGPQPSESRTVYTRAA